MLGYIFHNNKEEFQYSIVYLAAAGHCLMIMSNLYCWSGFNLVSIKVVVDRVVSFD